MVILLTLVRLTNLAFASDEVPKPESWGRTSAIEFSTGTQGILSFAEVGVRSPMMGRSMFVDLKVRFLSSLTWATFIHLETGESVSFHPDVVGGVVSFGGYSPMLYGVLRMYGQVEIFLGYSFTPWDSAIYGTDNLFGDNVTYAFWGSFGFELRTGDAVSVFLDAGGGFKSLFGDKSNPYVVAGSWLGSGFGIKMGMRFYL
jgi:hypothetical protein